LAIVVAATVMRVGLVLATGHFVPWGDPADYQRHGIWIAAGGGFPPTIIATPGTPSALRSPAYPYLLGGVYAIAGTNPIVGRLLGAVLGVITVVLLAYLGRAIWDRRLGLVAGALCAFFLPLIGLNASLLSESLFLPLELALALCLVGLIRNSGNLRRATLCGILCGVAASTRSLGLLWLLPTVALVIRSTGGGRARWRSVAALLCAFAVVLTPWTIRNATAFHAFVPVSTDDGFALAGQYNQDTGRAGYLEGVWRVPTQVASLHPALVGLFLAHHGLVNEDELDSTLRHAGLSYLYHHPSQLPIASWLQTLRMIDIGIGHTFTTGIAYREMGLPHRLWIPTTLSIQLVVVVALAGLLARIRRWIAFRPGPWWLWSLPLLALVGTIPFVGTPRYLTPADPFLLMLAALAITAAIDRGLASRRPPTDP